MRPDEVEELDSRYLRMIHIQAEGTRSAADPYGEE
jgi:hypothetical protein